MNIRMPNDYKQYTLAAVGVIGGLAVGVGGLVGSAVSRSNANKRLGELSKFDPAYKANPLAAQRFGMAQTMLNARMPGAQRAENNIFANQASTIANVNKIATSGADAIQAAAGVQGQTNQQLDQLSQQEAADFQRRYGNYSQALDGQMEEANKLFADNVRRYGDKVGIVGAQTANRANTWGDIANTGFGIASLGMNSMGNGNSVGSQSRRLSRMPKSNYLSGGEAVNPAHSNWSTNMNDSNLDFPTLVNKY